MSAQATSIRARLRRGRTQATRRLRGAPNLEALRRAGMSVADDVVVAEDAFIDNELALLITIEEGVRIGPKVVILAHDASMKQYMDFTVIAPVHLKRGAFIGASAIILPGVTVGEGSVVGPGSVVTADVPDDTIVMGNPARPQGQVSELAEEQLRLEAEAPTWTRAQWPGTAKHSEDERVSVRQAIARAKTGFLR